MKPLREFHPKILPYVSGVPEPTLNTALIDAAVRFCEDTKVIMERTYPFTTTQGVLGYELDSPAQHRISNIERMWCNGHRMSALPSNRTPDEEVAEGTPRFFYGRRQDERFEVALFPVPDGEHSITAEVVYCPTRTATALDNDLLERWIDAIRAGTLAYLHGIPGQPFTDITMSASYGMAFLAKSAEAKRSMSFGRVSTSHRVNPRPLI
jgi:hypothetical protein